MAETKKSGRSPDYTLSVFDKETGARTNRAGVGWLNENKSITIVLNPGVGLHYDSKLLITLWDEAARKANPKDDFAPPPKTGDRDERF